MLEGSHLVTLGQEIVPFLIDHGVSTIHLGTREFPAWKLAERSITKQTEDF
jgi:hypothetical protein